MFEIEWNETSLNNFYKKMDRLVKNLKKHAYEGVQQASIETQKTALDFKPGSKNEEFIQVELEKTPEGIKGKIHTNREKFNYALFLEYGTGIYAEMPHIGVTELFITSGFSVWLLPIDKAPRPLGNPIWYSEKLDMSFYLMFSQQPQPFMRPAAFYRRQPNIDVIKKSIKKGIKEDLS